MASMFDPMRYSGPTSLGRRMKGRCYREKQESLHGYSYSARRQCCIYL